MTLKMFSICKYSSWTALIIIQVISYGSYTILVHLCEENGAIKFHSSSVNFLIELFKLLLSVLCFLYEYFIKRIRINNNNENNIFSFKKDFHALKKNDYKTQKSVRINIDDDNNTINFSNKFETSKQFSSHNISSYDSLKYAIPAFLYFINNNLAVYIQLFMDSTSYQMMSNLKIFSTAVLYYLIMGKSLTKIKWMSLCLLFFAGIFYSLANIKSPENYYLDELDLDEFISKNDDKNRKFLYENKFDKHKSLTKLKPIDQIHITDFGFLLMIVYCFISGLSGVYNEYLLKLNYRESIYVQNMYLYVYGCLLNLLFVIYQIKIYEYSSNENNSSICDNFFRGFNYYTWTIIITQVFNGFLMSFLMKYSNNITRLFVISSSLIITTFLSVIIFSLKLNVYFYFCFMTIMFALYFYYLI